MPPKKPNKGKAPAKATKKKGKTTPGDQPSSPSEEEADAERNPSAEKDDDDEFSDHQMEVMVTFFEDRPYYYDLAHEHYKNKQKKSSGLKELGEQMGIDRKWLSYC